MRRLFFAFVGLVVGYLLFAILGYFLIEALSTTSDRDVEAAMTSAFAIGPFGALVGLVVGFMRGGRKTIAPAR
jgi:ABC-type antimicrobial peptide transport system permease subunit